MKRTLWLTSTLALALAGLVFSGCGSKPASPPEPGQAAKVTPGEPKTSAPKAKGGLASAVPNSFEQVTAQLDPGGSLYLYLGTEQWLDGLSAKVAGFRKIADAIPELKSDDRENVGKAFDVVTHVLKDSGVEEVSGFGMSAISPEKGVYHSKTMLHHYKGKGSGFLWTMFGQKPHALEGLNLLPATTAFASFSDLDLPLAWSVIQKEVAQSGFPEVEQGLAKVTEQFEKVTGLKWDKVMASLGGEFGFALTLDETKKITLPLPGASAPLEMPEPGLLLIAKTKDDTIFNRVDEVLKATGQAVVSTDKDGLKMRTLSIPLPIPIQLRPSVATKGGYLFIASTDSIIQEALAVQAGEKKGLKASGEFQRLAADIPAQGNNFSYWSPRLSGALKETQRNALALAPNGPQLEWLQSMFTTTNLPCSYAVGANTEEGWKIVGNANQHPAKLLAVPVVIPMLAAIAVPNFVKAREAAQKNACINNLRQIDGAKQQWALENKKEDSAISTREELQPFLKSFPTCPAGGEYTINAVSEAPRCNHAGHRLVK
jgi:competence protein ComGC